MFTIKKELIFLHFLFTVIHIYSNANFYLFIVKIALLCVFTFKLVSVLYFTKKNPQSQNLSSNMLLIGKLKVW